MPETPLVDTLDILVTDDEAEAWISEFAQEKKAKQRIYRKIEEKVKAAANTLEERYKAVIDWFRTHKREFYDALGIPFDRHPWDIVFDPSGNPIIPCKYCPDDTQDLIDRIYLTSISRNKRYVTFHPNPYYGGSVTLDIKKGRVFAHKLSVRSGKVSYVNFSKQIKTELDTVYREQQQTDHKTFTQEVVQSANNLIRRYSTALIGIYNFILPIDQEGASELIQPNQEH